MNPKGSQSARAVLMKDANNHGAHARVNNPKYKSPKTGKPPATGKTRHRESRKK